MIAIEHLTFQYQGSPRPALRDINLTVADGEFLGVAGPAGAGKTTLTNALNGVVPHHFAGDFFGAVKINGMDTVTTSPTDLARCVGSVFQDIDGQMVASVVEDEVLFALENFGFPRAEISRRLEEALDRFGLADLRYRSLASLSGGQKQKVAIAAIMALTPRVLVLDEPTGELDPVSSETVFAVLEELNRAGTTIVVVEQKMALLCAHARRLAILGEGELLREGPVREVMRDAAVLAGLGIRLPRVVELAGDLRARGLYDGPAPLNTEEAERMAREVMG